MEKNNNSNNLRTVSQVSKDYDFANIYYTNPDMYEAKNENQEDFYETNTPHYVPLNDPDYYENTSYSPYYAELPYPFSNYYVNSDAYQQQFAEEKDNQMDVFFSTLPIANNQKKKKVQFGKFSTSILEYENEGREPWHKFYYKVPPKKEPKHIPKFGFDNQTELPFNKAQRKVIVTDNVVKTNRQLNDKFIYYNSKKNLSKID